MPGTLNLLLLHFRKIVVVVVLFNVHGKHLRSCRDTFSGQAYPPKRLTTTTCTLASNWQLPFLKKRKEKRKYVAGALPIALCGPAFRKRMVC